MRGRLVIGASAALLGLVGAWGGSPASAQVHHGTVDKSSTISGYQINGKAVTTLAATIVVPKVTCKSGEAFELALALTGTLGLPPVQFSSFSEGAVDVLCAKSAFYTTRVIADETQSKSSLTLKAGQKVEITITQSSKGALVTLRDEATKKSVREYQPTSLGKFQLSFAQFGTQPLDIGSSQAAVPKFSSIPFQDVEVNRKLLATEHPIAYELIYHGKVSVLPTAITSSKNFHLDFKSN